MPDNSGSPLVTFRTHPLMAVQKRSDNPPKNSARLDLLCDLTVAAAVGFGALHLTNFASGATGFASLLGFVLAVAVLIFTWVQSAWFVAGFEVDDWASRLTQLLLFAGATFFGIGMGNFIIGIAFSQVIVTVMAIGLVMMKSATIISWLRVYLTFKDPLARAQALRLSIITVGWGVVFFPPTPAFLMGIAAVVLVAAEVWSSPVTNKSFRTGAVSGAVFVAHIDRMVMLLLALLVLSSTITVVGAMTSFYRFEPMLFILVLMIAASALAVWWIYSSAPVMKLLDSNKNALTLYVGWSIFYLVVTALFGAGMTMSLQELLTRSLSWPAVSIIGCVVFPLSALLAASFLLGPVLFKAFPVRRLDMTLFGATLFALLLALIVAGATGNLYSPLFVTCLAPWIVIYGFESSHRGQAKTTEAGTSKTAQPATKIEPDETA